MPIDASLYSKLQPVDLTGSVERGLRLGDMIQQSRLQNQAQAEDQAMKDAMKRNMSVGADGAPTLNRKAYLSEMAGINPMKAMEQSKTFAQMDRDEHAAKIKAAQDKINMTSQLLGSVTDQSSYEKAVGQAVNLGLVKPGEMPAQYDPKQIKQLQLSSLSAKDWLEQQNKNRDYDLNNKKVTSEVAKNTAEIGKIKAETQKAGVGSKGQEEADKAFGKDYIDWTTTGRNTVDKNLQRLYAAKKALKEDPSLTGPIAGLTPDVVRNLTNERAIKTRDDVRAAAQGALKATLGAQFTEKEGERIMNQAYNEKLSPEANIEKIDAAIKELEANRDANERKSAYFQAHKGTLAGMDNTAPMQPAVAAQQLRTQSVAAQAHPEANQALQWAKENPNDPRAQAIMQRLGQ